jgi:5-methylcytosine-specific restriction protein A
VHLFEVFDRGRYIYAGEVELVARPYQEEQPDVEGRPRQVWMFPLKLKQGGLGKSSFAWYRAGASRSRAG